MFEIRTARVSDIPLVATHRARMFQDMGLLPDASTPALIEATRMWPAIGLGRQGIGLNVYTEPRWRRRGVARSLMTAVLSWARAERLESLVLHAAPDGRARYEELGFVATNEMRLPA